jgi:hypothetical protein
VELIALKALWKVIASHQEQMLGTGLPSSAKLRRLQKCLGIGRVEYRKE